MNETAPDMTSETLRAAETPGQSALLLANDLFQTVYAKTSHGLVRGPSRWPVAGVIDASCAGQDAGELLDGEPRKIPIFASVEEALERLGEAAAPTHCVVGVATVGGVLPPALRRSIEQAVAAGLTVVNGLHHLLSEEEPALVELARRSGATLLDIRRPPRTSKLHFWSGEILDLEIPRVAVLGTDCALGKRTTAGLLRQALAARGVRAEMIYTGQTGWLQGYRHGFIFDSTPNDFVCGELEHAILRCAEETSPQVILIEGQSSLQNPSGPCGAEFLLSGASSGVILQHAPGRRCFEGLDERDCRIPSPASEIALICHYGVPVWGVGVHTEGLSEQRAAAAREALEKELGLPVVLPLGGGAERLAAEIMRRLDLTPGPAAEAGR